VNYIRTGARMSIAAFKEDSCRDSFGGRLFT